MPPAATPILTCSSLSARPGTRCAGLTRRNGSAAAALRKSRAWPGRWKTAWRNLSPSRARRTWNTCAISSGKSNLDFPPCWNWPWCWRNWSCGHHLRCRATPAPPRLMISNPAPLAAADDTARTIAGHLAFRAGARSSSVPDVRNGDGFPRDFATADGERIMVAAITRQQFADLAKATRLARTFAFLERVLYADFSTCSDLYTHRETIAALLAPWFSRRTVADLAAA